MDLNNVTYQGPEIDDEEILAELPNNLASLISQVNGFILYHGGFHLFGACKSPIWHSIRELWKGDGAAYGHYEGIADTDVPFAEDCLGYQFFLRDGQVLFLDGQTGYIEDLGMGLRGFLQWITEKPVENLGMEPLQQFMDDGNICEPGRVLSEYPFYCFDESKNGVTLSSVSSMEKRTFLADLYKQLKDVEPHSKVDIKVVNPFNK